ncbi:hypothetical protein M1278_01405 [Candidatus Marsarchaeota archaeon]|nr:hypothetical protein [Candidatus Marsarchaeota archaeon]
MSFFGLIISSSLIFAVLILVFMIHMAILANNIAMNFNLNKNIETVEIFENIINMTQNSTNKTQYTNWINAINISAKEDALNIKIINKSLEISTKTNPQVFSFIQIK